ncbi:MAG: DNA/RNA nuclease SfsA [Clostridia bacterium]|nr:DNA/RNA nuclease SfsA [Clostridia bacterium]
MHYPVDSVVRAIFLRRPNRFIAHCLLDGEEVICHVKNTGRCRELLIPGAVVYLCRAAEGSVRKTAYDLIVVEKAGRLINMDSQAPNKAAEAFLRTRFDSVRAEVQYGESRMDFLAEKGGLKTYVEVKGVTLEKDGAVFFPDAPTERGVRHIRELIRAVGEGHGAVILFVIQMEDVRYFAPNDATDPAFGKALREAAEAGVAVWAYCCHAEPDSMEITDAVEVRLHGNRTPVLEFFNIAR